MITPFHFNSPAPLWLQSPWTYFLLMNGVKETETQIYKQINVDLWKGKLSRFDSIQLWSSNDMHARAHTSCGPLYKTDNAS